MKGDALAKMTSVVPKDLLLQPIGIGVQRAAAYGPDGEMYLDQEIAHANPVKVRDAFHLWFDRVPWMLIDDAEKEEAFRFILT
jgi:hypothetical protein